MEIKSLPFISTTDSRLLSRLFQDPSFSLKMDPSFLKMDSRLPPLPQRLLHRSLLFSLKLRWYLSVLPLRCHDSILTIRSTRPFDDTGYLGYDPRLFSQRFESFSLKDSATDSPIFHGSGVDDAFATQSASEAFSPSSIYDKSNSQGLDGGFGRSDDPIFPPPSAMLPEEGFALGGWRSMAYLERESYPVLDELARNVAALNLSRE
ncbi:hypothetical protein DVH24_023223 [Malus domestica]|uniref:Uncharacterized protein n=1 Tax=Malus domestica TaxID=3750 RepID=A0A498KLQ0_MALDO|nr:hypothetical protein DVH24_023223 [Malus domestica]